MKCPELYKTIQQNIRKPILDIDNVAQGEYHLLIETQKFGECYQEQCAAWDNENRKCKKFN